MAEVLLPLLLLPLFVFATVLLLVLVLAVLVAAVVVDEPAVAAVPALLPALPSLSLAPKGMWPSCDTAVAPMYRAARSLAPGGRVKGCTWPWRLHTEPVTRMAEEARTPGLVGTHKQCQHRTEHRSQQQRTGTC